MEWLASFTDLVLHLDKHLVFFVQQYGDWVTLLFAIIFAETGIVVAPSPGTPATPWQGRLGYGGYEPAAVDGAVGCGRYSG